MNSSILKIAEQIFNLLGKDPMSIRVKRFRLDGAKIGDGCRLFSSVTSAEPYLISIGNNVTISSGVKFITHDNAVIKCTEGTDLVGAISIGDNCFVGMNSLLLPGVSISDNCIVGAGSVVTKSCFEEGVVIAGNPAKKICTVNEYVEKNKDYIFDFRSDNRIKKKQLITDNPHKWLKK